MGEYLSLQNALFTQSHTIRSTFLITPDFKQSFPFDILFYDFLLVFIKYFSAYIHIADYIFLEVNSLFTIQPQSIINASWNRWCKHMSIDTALNWNSVYIKNYTPFLHPYSTCLNIGYKYSLSNLSGRFILERYPFYARMVAYVYAYVIYVVRAIPVLPRFYFLHRTPPWLPPPL